MGLNLKIPFLPWPSNRHQTLSKMLTSLSPSLLHTHTNTRTHANTPKMVSHAPCRPFRREDITVLFFSLFPAFKKCLFEVYFWGERLAAFSMTFSASWLCLRAKCERAWGIGNKMFNQTQSRLVVVNWRKTREDCESPGVLLTTAQSKYLFSDTGWLTHSVVPLFLHGSCALF